MLAAATSALTDRHAALSAAGMGVVLLLWGVVETLTLGVLGGAQVVLLACFVAGPGVALVAVGGRALRRA